MSSLWPYILLALAAGEGPDEDPCCPVLARIQGDAAEERLEGDVRTVVLAEQCLGLGEECEPVAVVRVDQGGVVVGQYPGLAGAGGPHVHRLQGTEVEFIVRRVERDVAVQGVGNVQPDSAVERRTVEVGYHKKISRSVWMHDAQVDAKT